MSKLFALEGSDWKKALVTAVIMGFLLPVAAMIQTPGFDVLTANWGAILNLAINGALTGFIAEIARRFGTDANGKFGGVL